MSKKGTSTYYLTSKSKIPLEIPPSLSSSYEALKLASLADSTWIPKIVIPIETPPIISQVINKSADLSKETDIVPFIAPPNLQLRTLYHQLLKYPKDCTFCFSGYGVTETKRLTDDILSAASKAGSHLTIEVNDSYQGRLNKYVWKLLYAHQL